MSPTKLPQLLLFTSLFLPASLSADIPHQQVHLQTRFLEVSNDFLEDIGVSFDSFRPDNPLAPFVVGLRGGYDGNIYGSANNRDSSAFTALDLAARFELTDFWNIQLGVTEVVYEDAPLSRSGADNYAHNYMLRSNFDRQVNDRLRLTNRTSIDYGSLGRQALNDVSTGILGKGRTWFRTSTSFYYRPVGAFNDRGWRWRLNYQGRIYNQSGDNYLDTHQFMLALQLAYIVNPQLAFWASVAHRERDWREYDFDSYGYLFAAGVYGIFPCGAHYRFAINHERRHYDNSQLADRDVWGYDFLVYGIYRLWQWGVYCNYGIIDPNLPGNFYLYLADAKGKRCGAYLRREFAQVYIATLFCHALLLDADIFNASNQEANYFYSGVGLERRLSDDSSIGVSVGAQVIEYKNGANRDRESSAVLRFQWLLAL